MNIIDKLNSRFRIINSQNPACLDEINDLKEFSLIDIPSEYLELIEEKTDIEMRIDNEVYMCIWGAEGCVDMNDSMEVQECLPKSLAIGSDGGSAILAYLFGEKGFGLYLIWEGDLDTDSSVKIANNLNEFLVEGLGIDIFRRYYCSGREH